ncbi:MAG: phage portal protein [Oscillospiraceae bacterium]|jgi:HK97 family phage portal protein|nr:phage portal protein [Oscillospiraceae bacterium]
MNPFRTIFRQRDRPKDRLGGGFSFLFGGTPSGTNVTEQTAMQNTAVYACVRILAEAVASLPLHVYRCKADGGKDRAPDHPLYPLLHNAPNEDMTSYTFRETMMSHLLLWGNAYAQIVRNGRGQVLSLYPLLPNRMEVSRAANGKLVYTYTRDSDDPGSRGGPITLQRSDVLHIPGLGFDGIIGYSPIAMARNAIGMCIATENYGARFFANSARPSGVLEHPGVLKDFDKLRQSWQAQFSGSNQHSIAILEESMKFHPISINPNDAQFLDTRKFQILEIARIFRIPPSFLGDLDRATFSNAEQLSLDFVKFTLAPWLTRFEQGMEQSLLLPSEKNDIFIRHNVEGLLRGDYKTRLEAYSIGIQNGFMSPNDVRSIEDWNLIPESEGGNGYYVNGNMLPLRLAKEGAYVKKQQDVKEANG